MHCNPTSAGGHGYIIVDVGYFTKWVEEMATYGQDGKNVTLFLFNHFIYRFRVPQVIVTNHGSHFHNQMMTEISTKLGFHHENSTSYYPQDNGQVESINKVLNTMLCRKVGEHKSNWHLTLFLTHWPYITSINMKTCFTPFQLIYGLEPILPIECEIL